MSEVTKTLEQIDAERNELRDRANKIRTARDGQEARTQRTIVEAAAANPIPFQSAAAAQLELMNKPKAA